LILSGSISGGGLQLTGTGVLSLAGSLDATSFVTVANGATLDLPGTLTLEQNATLTDNGRLTVDQGGVVDDFGLVIVGSNATLVDSSSGIPGVAGVQVEQGAELNVQGALTVQAGGTLDDFASLTVASTGSLVDQSSGGSGAAGVQVEPGAILANQGTVQAAGTAAGNGVLLINGLMTGSLTVASRGFLEGTGSVGNVTAVNGGTIVPGSIGSIGILSAQSVNLTNGGVLYIQVSGYQGPGTGFSRLDTGSLILGGTSKLTLDLSGLATRGTVEGIVSDGGQTGTFGTVQVLNDPFSFGANVLYRNNNVDVTIF
jgi:hypothetical protein